MGTPPPIQLSQKELARVQKFPCNGKRCFAVGRKRDLTYAQAYDAIFQDEGCKVSDGKGDKPIGHRTFTHSAMKRIGSFNETYWRGAKEFIHEEWERQKKEVAEINAQIVQAKAAAEQFEAWEKELKETTDGDRVQLLREMLEASPYMRDTEGKLVNKPRTPVDIETRPDTPETHAEDRAAEQEHAKELAEA